MSKPNDRSPKPAYVSYRSLVNYLDGIRELGRIPDVVDRGTMKNFSGATQNELIPALRFLGMINEKSVPTDLFMEYALADDDSRKASLGAILRNAYGFIFDNVGFNIERATENQTADLFRQQGLNGSTNSRAIAFFLSAAKDAGIKVSPYVKAPTIQRPATAKPRKAKLNADHEAPLKSTAGAQTPPGTHQFEIPLPCKGSVRVILPNNIDADDWHFISTTFAAYMKRWKGFEGSEQTASRSHEAEQ